MLSPVKRKIKIILLKQKTCPQAHHHQIGLIHQNILFSKVFSNRINQTLIIVHLLNIGGGFFDSGVFAQLACYLCGRGQLILFKQKQQR